MKPKTTVKTLRAAGHLVKVSHLRRVTVNKKFLDSLKKVEYRHIAKGHFGELETVTAVIPQVVLPKGGETQLTVDLKTGEHFQVNTVCSRHEAYNKKKGLKVCLDRLVNAINHAGVNL